MRGKFITFEGPEGSGKSTQGKLLVKYLKSKGRKALFLREPGGTSVSEKIRKILLDKSNHRISSLSEMLLYMAARAQLVQEIIKPALARGYFVVCDRFLDSTIAYQGYGLGINLSLIEHLGKSVTFGIKPDLTIFLDVEVKKGLRACGRKLDRIEQRSLAYHQRVRRGYLALASRYPGRIKIVKPDKQKAETQAEVRKIIKRYVL
ncbi:MAG: dTMP kinase [Candidatus Omnitrophota bacterium]|jgi:dTMP kinase